VSDGQEQFEQVFHGCYDAVYRYAVRRVAPEAVQDVVADTFLVAWRRHTELDGEPLPWLFGIARRVAANQRRGSARRDALQEHLRANHSVSSERSDVSGHDLRLAAALGALEERDREALMLVAWEELDHRDAAKAMGCSTGAFTVRLHRARRKLARVLAGQETDSIEIAQEARSSL
jgi:RNA polymerase sigma-70 factor (ECF subfamily)